MSTDSTAAPAIREATIADIDDIVSLRMQFLIEMEDVAQQDRAVLAEKTREYFLGMMGTGDVRVWFLEIKRQIVATAAYVLFRRAPVTMKMATPEAYLFNVYTLPAFRRRGYATQLMDRMVAEARKAGLSRIWLRASENGAAVYAKLGFKFAKNVMEL